MAAHIDMVARYPKLLGATPKTTYNNKIYKTEQPKSINICTTANAPKLSRTPSSKSHNSQMNSARPNSLPLMVTDLKENQSKKCQRKSEIPTIKAAGIKPYSLPGTPIDESLLKCYKDLLIRFSKAQVALEELSLQNSAQQETIKNWRPILRDAILVGNDGRSCISSSKSSSSCCNSSNFLRDRLIMTPCEDEYTNSSTAKINNSILKCQDYLEKSKFHCQPSSHLSQSSSSCEIAHLFKDVPGKDSQDSTSSDQNTILQNILQIQAIEEKLDALQQTFTIDDLLSMGNDGQKTNSQSTAKADTFLHTWTNFKQHWNVFQENANTLIQDHSFNNLELDEKCKELDRASQNELWEDDDNDDLLEGTDELTVDFLRSELARLEKKVESFQEAIFCVLDVPFKTGSGQNFESKTFEAPPECMTASLDSQTSSIITVIEKKREEEEPHSLRSRFGSQDLSPHQTPTDFYESLSPLYQTSTLKKGSQAAKQIHESIGNVAKPVQVPTYTVPHSFSTKFTSSGRPLTSYHNTTNSVNRSYERNYTTLSRSDNMIDNFIEHPYKGIYENLDNTAIYCTPLRDVNQYATTKSPLGQDQDLNLRTRAYKPHVDTNNIYKRPINSYMWGRGEKHSFLGNHVTNERFSMHSKSYDEAAQIMQPTSKDSSYSIDETPLQDVTLEFDNQYHNLFHRWKRSDCKFHSDIANRSCQANLDLGSFNGRDLKQGCRYSLNKTYNHLALPDLSHKSCDVVKLDQCSSHHCRCSVVKAQTQKNFPLPSYSDYLSAVQASVKTHECGCYIYQNCSCMRPLSLYSLKEKRSSTCTKQLKKLIRKSDGIYYFHQTPGLVPCCEFEPLPIILAENVSNESKFKKTLKIKANTLKLRLIKRGDETRHLKGLDKNHFSSTQSLSNTTKDTNDQTKKYNKEVVKNECRCKQRHNNSPITSFEKGDLDARSGVKDADKRTFYKETQKDHCYEEENYGVLRGWKPGESKVKQRKKKSEVVKNTVKRGSQPAKQPKSKNDIKILFQNIINIFKSNSDKNEQTSF